MLQPPKCASRLTDKITTETIYYSGDSFPEFNVTSGDLLTDVIEKIFQSLTVVPDTAYAKVVGGKNSQTGNGINKVFTFAHTLGELPSGVSVVSENSTNFKTTFNTTNITTTYTIAPANGEVITWTFIAVKNKN